MITNSIPAGSGIQRVIFNHTNTVLDTFKRRPGELDFLVPIEQKAPGPQLPANFFYIKMRQELAGTHLHYHLEDSVSWFCSQT